MRHTSRTLTALAVLLTGCAPAAARSGDATPAPRPPLAAVVDSVTRAPPLDRTHWGIHVTTLDGRALLERNAELLFASASNAKLPTIAAALELLGPEHRWVTAVEAQGLTGGVARALIVRGSGDPTLSSHFHDDPLAPLDSLADSLYAAGLRRVEGPLVVDQSAFDSVLVHPAWENFDLDWYYAAPAAPFAVMEGAYPVVVTPTRVGEPARVEVLAPAGLIALDARVMTVEGGRRWNDDLRRPAGTDSLIMRGEIGAEVGPDTSRIAQDDPGRFAGRAFRLALERRGIAVAGPVVATRHAAGVPGAEATGPPGAPPGGRVAWRSAPLAGVARIALEQSDNWISEQVLKTLGVPAADAAGSGWSEGTAVVEEFMVERAGVPSDALYLRDGSGLTPQTLMTPGAVTALLRSAAVRPWGPLFRDALPSPGERDGTLEDRLEGYGASVAAKTGTLRHVNALSGYARRAGGDVVVFSILTNASGRPSSAVQAALDRIVVAILESGS